jgi:methionyl-tRNA formyltransferase
MMYDQINKIILFGGSKMFCDAVRISSKQSNLKLFCFCAKRHLDEKIDSRETLRQFLTRKKIAFVESVDINTEEKLKQIVDDRTLGLAFGAAWIFTGKTVRLFKKNQLLDFMGIDLPNYDGGAHYTWKILNQNKKNGAYMQVIKGGERLFHQGEIVKGEKYKLPQNLKRPIDYFNYITKIESKFLNQFLTDVAAGDDFSFKKLNFDQGTFYPFLSSINQGFINWSWSGKNILLFINAFDDPYVGASTFMNKRRVFLKDASLLKTPEKYHPFTAGIVLRKNNQGLFIAALGGLLNIKKINDAQGRDALRDINKGDRLYTPYCILDEANFYSASYNAKGLRKKI